MRRAILVLAVLALCLPMVGEGQSIQHKGSSVATTPSGSGFFASGVSLGNTSASPYANLFGDAANTLALRNGANPQTFSVYNTFTDASNNESLQLTWDSNIARLQTASSGTGLSRSLYVLSKNALGLGDTSTARIFLLGSEFYPSVTDSVSLGRAAGDRFYKDVHVSRATLGSKTKALTEGSPTTVATVAVPQTAGSNFAAGEVQYTVYASDGTDTQTLNGSAFFSAVNKAGTEACQLTDDQIGTEAASAGTLVCTVACAVGLTDVVGITFDCTSSLSQTSLNALVRFDMQQPNTLTFP